MSVGGLNFINLKENNYIYAQNKTIYQNEDKKEEKGKMCIRDRCITALYPSPLTVIISKSLESL